MLKQVLGYLRMRKHQLQQDIQICDEIDDKDYTAYNIFCEGGLNEVNDILNYVETLIELENAD